jgi:hypothetical protein
VKPSPERFWALPVMGVHTQEYPQNVSGGIDVLVPESQAYVYYRTGATKTSGVVRTTLHTWSTLFWSRTRPFAPSYNAFLAGGKILSPDQPHDPWRRDQSIRPRKQPVYADPDQLYDHVLCRTPSVCRYMNANEGASNVSYRTSQSGNDERGTARR